MMNRALIFLLFVCCVVSAFQMGAVVIDWHDWQALFTIILTRITSNAPAIPLGGDLYVLWHLRIPRVLLAVLVGGSLGLSGSLVQGLFRNPLADPSLLGITSGAACAAALTIVLLSEQSLAVSLDLRIWLLPIASFIGAFATCMTLNAGSRWLTSGSMAGLLLLGVAFNALGVAVIGLCTYLATDEQLRSLSFWTLGSLAGASWLMTMTVGALLVLVCVWARNLAERLNALSLGEATAAQLGVAIPRLRWTVSILVALLAGLSVAFCGVIGFVGLIAPHLARIFFGADQHILMPVSMVLGAILLLAADTLARTLVIPAEIPVGIFTALLGGPFLILLLRSSRLRTG
jgi:iron complex transport system permease protein